MLRVKQKIYEAVLTHARSDSPLEACGYLAADGDGLITHSFPMTNMDKAEDHYTLDPAEQFAAVKQMRTSGLRLAAIYHSHPATPARPSVEDIRLAYDPDIHYLIATLVEGEKELRAFRIQKGQVCEEEIELVTGDW